MPGFARAHRSLPVTAGAMLASALLATAAVAQSYPAAPVRVIVPFDAGGATDSWRGCSPTVCSSISASRSPSRTGAARPARSPPRRSPARRPTATR